MGVRPIAFLAACAIQTSRAWLAKPVPRNDVALRVEVPSLYEEAEKALTNRGEFEEELLGAGGPALEATAGPLAAALAAEGVARCDGALPAKNYGYRTYQRTANAG